MSCCQHTVPAVLSSLVECRKALDSYLETCLKNGTATDIYVKEANALAIGTFEHVCACFDQLFDRVEFTNSVVCVLVMLGFRD